MSKFSRILRRYRASRAEPWEQNYDPPVNLTDLECAIVKCIFAKHPELKTKENCNLRVVGRQYTVVGLFADFHSNWLEKIKPRKHNILFPDVLIESPEIDCGGGALAFTDNYVLLGIEMFAHGSFFGENISEFEITDI